uniref:Uncharacterized protein n=1 Tax=Myoviridae sp. cted82 TaxID=2827696 RepID=A0A8S5TNS1_9CAUD|nr:MAG TPA: hypothetical protein [Myoviridae sp. cted82]
MPHFLPHNFYNSYNHLLHLTILVGCFILSRFSSYQVNIHQYHYMPPLFL